jgi:condensin complex subunit 1
MDNAIFKKLSDMIQNPSHSREWFGMAEQAINTIYALCEHPDTLCNEIIKSLTRRVFAKDRIAKKREQSRASEKDADAMDEDKQQEEDNASDAEKLSDVEQEDTPGDTGDAFELSQLLFVVGHVAIKQIVYLELVEREWKRQKDEKEKGRFFSVV